jgi:hypothetical protein
MVVGIRRLLNFTINVRLMTPQTVTLEFPTVSLKFPLFIYFFVSLKYSYTGVMKMGMSVGAREQVGQKGVTEIRE